MSSFTPEEKQRFFIERTQDLWPQNWQMYLDLIQHETWSKEELDFYNFEQRKKILSFAYENTVFYKKLYDSVGLKPQDIKTEKDWNSVPIVTKEMVFEHFEQIKVSDEVVNKFGFPANTGGSTGIPLKIYRDRRHFWQAPYWRFYGWHLERKCGDIGVSHHLNRAFNFDHLPCTFSSKACTTDFDVPIWGMDQVYINRTEDFSKGAELRQKEISFWPIVFYYLNSYSHFDDEVENFCKNIEKSPLAHMYAYAGALDTFADYCIAHSIHFSNFKFIESCASSINQVIRNKVKKVFGCDVFDYYGSNEMGPIAVECAKSGKKHHLHVLSDLLHVELIDECGNLVKGEQEGTVVVTCFTNRVFPFIKYNHGDKTHWITNPCDCKLPFPCIAPIDGRETDYFLMTNGQKLHSNGFASIFDAYPNCVRQFQFVQSKAGYVTLNVVPNKNFANYNSEILTVLNTLNADWKNKLKFELKQSEQILHDGGKYRFIVHKVDV